MKTLYNLYNYLSSFFTNRVAIIINSQRKSTSRYVAISRIKNYLHLLTSSSDTITIMMQDKDDYTKIHDFEISLDENNQYIFTWLENSKYWILTTDKNGLIDLLLEHNLYKIIKNPSDYSLVKQISLKVTCYKKPEFIAKDIHQIIECINQLEEEYNNDFDVIYVYDYDTNMEFTFEIYEGKYSFAVFAHYRYFEKNELIDFLYTHDLIIFTKLNEDPEKFGFEFADDGGI